MFGLYGLALPVGIVDRLSGRSGRGPLACEAPVGFESTLIVSSSVTPLFADRWRPTKDYQVAAFRQVANFPPELCQRLDGTDIRALSDRTSLLGIPLPMPLSRAASCDGRVHDAGGPCHLKARRA